MTYDPEQMGAFCRLCPLNKKKPCPPEPPAAGSIQYAIVGEGPGSVEEKLGRPFVGKSGQLLWGLVRDAGGPGREVALVTNATLCKPEGDKDAEKAAVCCAPRLLKELAALPPEVPVLTLGKVACHSVLGTKRLMYARGFVWHAKKIDEKVVKAAARKALKTKKPEDELKAATIEGRAGIGGRVVVPSIHPAFVLRADNWRPILEVDIRRFLRWVRGELKQEDLGDGGAYKVVADVRSMEECLAMLDVEVGCDIETDGIDPLTTKILCVAVSDGEHTLVIQPWRPEFAEPLRKFFETRKTVVGHNFISFDELVMSR